MTDRGSQQSGKVSFKSLDSESMAAARAAAQAAGLTLEEWLSRTILKNAAKLGIEPGSAPPDAEESVHGTDEEAREDAQRSLEAITRHLEEAQQAADAAGVSVAEWLSRAIIRSTQDGHEAMTRYVRQQRSEDDVEDVETPSILSGGEVERPGNVEEAEPSSWDEEEAQTLDAVPEGEGATPFPDESPDLEEHEPEAWPGDGAADFGMPEPPGEQGTSLDGPPAEEPAEDADETADNEMRAAEIVTRRQEEQEEPDSFRFDRSPTDDPDEPLELTTPALQTARGWRENLLGGEEEEPERPRRRWLSWFWSTLLILLAVLAAAIWILPNIDELGLSDVLGVEESEIAADSNDSQAGADSGTQENAAGADTEEQATESEDASEETPAEDRPAAGGDERSLADLDPEEFPQPAEENVAWYRQAAEAGNAHAQYTLATLYLQGNGVDRDFNQAAALFRQAADEGNLASAQYALGVLYERGLGVEEDALEALIMFQKAADQGYVLALTKVGEAYLHGHGIGQDYDQAQRYFERAAESGEANAQYGLGRMYELGLGVEQNLVQALKWFTLAAERDHGEAAGRVEAIVPEMTQAQRDRAADLVVEHNRRFGESRRDNGAR